MIDIKQEIEKYGLTEESYESCLSDIKKKVDGEIDLDWAEIVEKYGLNIHGDTLRKASQTIFGGVFIQNYFKNKMSVKDSSESYLVQLRHEKEELKKERQKLSDEKLEYNRWLREQSRDELICEKICDAIKHLEPLTPPGAEIDIRTVGRDQECVLCFADTHYGTEFTIKGLYGEVINSYSPEIFEERMNELLIRVIDIVFEKALTNIRIFSLGDELDGVLRASQLRKLRYGVVDSTIKYSEYICNWLNELSRYVHIDFYATQGNHTELRLISQPKGTFADENMTFVINEFIQTRMQGNPNFTFHKNETGLIFDNICGYNVLGIHGEVKSMENALLKFSNTYGVMIDVLVGGHKHHFSAEAIGRDREVINVPSVMGIDDYAMSLGKTSAAGATLFVLERNEGVVERRHFKL